MRILDAYEPHARFNPDKVAARDLERAFTWRELYARAGRWSAALRGAGLGYRDVVTVVAGNSAELLALYAGAAGAGIAIAPLNPMLRAGEMTTLMEIAGPGLVVAEAAQADVAREAAAAFADPPPVVTLEALAALADELEPAFDARVTGDEPFSIYFTSGTTGRPKGVFRTQHRTMLDGYVTSLALTMAPSDDLYLFLPLFHMGGYHSAQIALLVGATVSIRRGFAADDLDRSMREGITVVMGVPAIWAEFLRAERGTFPSLRIAYIGGSTATVAVLERLRHVFPNAGVMHTYGLTEGGFIASLRPEDSFAHLGSIGRPLPGVTVAIHDPDGNEVPTGVSGELVLRDPPGAMEGYWRDPETTAEAFRGPWLRTGDIGYVDDTGHLHIVGRSKEIIISKGENIAPAEIESVLSGHPAVLDCVVLGMPDPEYEEMVVAAVQLEEGATPSDEELIAYVAERVARFKRPRRIFFVDEFPRTSLGKIAKPVLAEQLFLPPR